MSLVKSSPSRCGNVILAGCAILVALSACVADDPPPWQGLSAERPCPPWGSFPRDRHDNSQSPFYGCASTANLRAMVEDPADLLVGRRLGPADGEQQTRAVEAYREGRVKAFQGSGASGSPAQSAAPGAASKGSE